MNREAFNALIEDAEKAASCHPRRFKWCVGSLAALGFGYLLSALLLFAGVTVALLLLIISFPNVGTIKLGLFLGLPAGGLCWAIMRGLFVRIPAPEGRRLTPAEAPALFRLVEELRAKLGATAFHDVLLVPEHNAAVVQTPRLGVFGWHRNSLLLGLPLMQGVSVEEFRAILAHEFAHLSGAHGKFGTWIYRLRQTWERVFDNLARQNRGSFVLTKFLGWFWPRFNARAFVLSRLQEYQADRTAAEATNAQLLASGLIRTQLQGRWLEERFWPDFFRRARDVDVPPQTLFREMAVGFNSLHAHPETSRWLNHAFNFPTNSADTHPSLTDRIGALKRLDPALQLTASPEHLSPPKAAASTLLDGTSEALLADELSQAWAALVTPGWKERHVETLRLSEELARHESLPSDSKAEGLWLRAQIVLDRDGDEAARPLLEALLAQNPNHAGANLILGRIMLDLDDSRGVALVEQAMKEDRSLTEPACNFLHGYYARTAQPDNLAAVEKLYDEHSELMLLAEAERASAVPGDSFHPPDLTEVEQASLNDVFQKFSRLDEVHVARKEVRHLPEMPMYVIALRVRQPWWKMQLSSHSQALVDSVVKELTLRGHFLVFVDEANLRKLAKALRKVPNSLVYKRV